MSTERTCYVYVQNDSNAIVQNHSNALYTFIHLLVFVGVTSMCLSELFQNLEHTPFDRVTPNLKVHIFYYNAMIYSKVCRGYIKIYPKVSCLCGEKRLLIFYFNEYLKGFENTDCTF